MIGTKDHWDRNFPKLSLDPPHERTLGKYRSLRSFGPYLDEMYTPFVRSRRSFPSLRNSVLKIERSVSKSRHCHEYENPVLCQRIFAPETATHGFIDRRSQLKTSINTERKNVRQRLCTHGVPTVGKNTGIEVFQSAAGNYPATPHQLLAHIQATNETYCSCFRCETGDR
jgi:hypothetical protein